MGRVQESYRGHQERERDCLLGTSHRCRVEKERKTAMTDWTRRSYLIKGTRGRRDLGTRTKECGVEIRRARQNRLLQAFSQRREPDTYPNAGARDGPRDAWVAEEVFAFGIRKRFDLQFGRSHHDHAASSQSQQAESPQLERW